jgi:hypothetical protein
VLIEKLDLLRVALRANEQQRHYGEYRDSEHMGFNLTVCADTLLPFLQQIVVPHLSSSHGSLFCGSCIYVAGFD